MTAALAAFDAGIFAGLMAAGLGERVGYLAPDGAGAIEVDALIDRGVQRIGEYGQVLGHQDEASFRRAEVEPVAGAILTCGADTWALVECLADDGSLSRWSLRRG